MRKPQRIAVALASAAIAVVGLSSCGAGGKEGGTLEMAYSSFPDYLDPALSYTAEGWTPLQSAYVPLLTYAHANGKAGDKVIPGLAKSLPKISNGGRTYTFQLRQGLRYSNGMPVKASDFGFAVERLFKLNSGGESFFTDIVGAAQFQKTKKGHISGIKANDKTGEIVINLTKPRGTFSNELALMFSAPLPQNTPIKDLTTDPPPATGPYAITKSEPGKSWVMERNPQWDRNNAKLLPDLPDGHVDKFNFTVVSNDATQVNGVESGQFDWMFDQPGPDLLPEVKGKYEGTQYRPEFQPSVYYFWMNNQTPPFNDVRVRQAVNYALDRKALEKIYGGEIAATQGMIPPQIPGYRKLDLYPHDMAKAKALIAQAKPSDRDITVWGDDETPNDDATTYLNDVLQRLGFHTKLKIINADNYFQTIGNDQTPDLDIGWTDWFQDYPHPADFLDVLMNGENILPTNNQNFCKVDDPASNRKLDQLGEQLLTPKVASEYSALDKKYMRQAACAPYGNRAWSTFVSDRIDLDAVIYNPVFSNDLTSFQLK